jgi:hypothetical protein
MNHDFESKDWADNHHHLSDGIDRLFAHIAKGVRQIYSRGSESSSKRNGPQSCRAEDHDGEIDAEQSRHSDCLSLGTK